MLATGTMLAMCHGYSFFADASSCIDNFFHLKSLWSLDLWKMEKTHQREYWKALCNITGKRKPITTSPDIMEKKTVMIIKWSVRSFCCNLSIFRLETNHHITSERDAHIIDSFSTVWAYYVWIKQGQFFLKLRAKGQSRTADTFPEMQMLVLHSSIAFFLSVLSHLCTVNYANTHAYTHTQKHILAHLQTYT